MSGPVDVLERILNCGESMGDVHAAVAELMEAAQAFSDSVTFLICDPRCELHCKLVDALAACRGAK